MRLYLAIAFSVLLCSCSRNENVAEPSPENNGSTIPYPYETAHFRFYYTSYDSASITAIGDTLERNYRRIVADLNSDSLLRVNVHFYRTFEELFNAVRSIVPNLPSWAIGLATAADRIHLLSPKKPGYAYPAMLRNLIHEFAHCVSLHVKANFANNPRWLWESVAIYEAGQFVHPASFSYMANHAPPTLSQLNSFSNTFVYEVGYLLAEYIIIEFGRQKYNELIRNNGDIQSGLGLNAAQFEAAWFDFVKTRYGI